MKGASFYNEEGEVERVAQEEGEGESELSRRRRG
jgi:hypothetical protein